MAVIPFSMADAIILSIVIVVMVLIIRGMLHGRIKSCDCGSCAGNCGSCGHACTAPRITLSEQQLAELHEIDQRAQGV